ncbi:MAG: hypothetical protein Q8L61_01745, partial [Hyphomicrobium sp.]|nr:hypothetical protein [Hyphomicrobium sp.]
DNSSDLLLRSSLYAVRSSSYGGSIDAKRCNRLIDGEHFEVTHAAPWISIHVAITAGTTPTMSDTAL